MESQKNLYLFLWSDRSYIPIRRVPGQECWWSYWHLMNNKRKLQNLLLNLLVSWSFKNRSKCLLQMFCDLRMKHQNQNQFDKSHPWNYTPQDWVVICNCHCGIICVGKGWMLFSLNLCFRHLSGFVKHVCTIPALKYFIVSQVWAIHSNSGVEPYIQKNPNDE